MKPRTAGILGMVGAAAVIVLCGFLIANPPFSILGALGLVAGAIAFAIAASWTVRKSWATSSLPEVRVRSEQKSTPLAFLILAGIYAASSIFRGSRDLVRGDSEGWIFISLGLMLIGLASAMYLWNSRQQHKK